MMLATPQVDADDGFTLIELLVVMTISIVLLFGTLMVFDSFTSQTTEQTRSNETSDQVRTAMDRTVNDLRGVSAILRADPNDLVYSVPDSPTSTRTRRICRSTSGDGAVYVQESSTSTNPGTNCTAAGATGWSVGRLATSSSSNSAANALFSYDGASTATNLTAIKSVGLTLATNRTSGGNSANSVLTASASVRRVAGASTALNNIKPDDFTVYCPNDGPKISIGADVLGLLPPPVTVVYQNDGGVQLGTGGGSGTLPVTLQAGVTTVVAKITDALGVTKTITKPVGCQS